MAEKERKEKLARELEEMLAEERAAKERVEQARARIAREKIADKVREKAEREENERAKAARGCDDADIRQEPAKTAKTVPIPTTPLGKGEDEEGQKVDATPVAKTSGGTNGFFELSAKTKQIFSIGKQTPARVGNAFGQENESDDEKKKLNFEECVYGGEEDTKEPEEEAESEKECDKAKGKRGKGRPRKTQANEGKKKTEGPTKGKKRKKGDVGGKETWMQNVISNALLGLLPIGCLLGFAKEVQFFRFS